MLTSPPLLQQVITKFDIDGSGAIEPEEFARLHAFFEKQSKSAKEPSPDFKAFDASNDGKLQKSEVKLMLESLGLHVDDAYLSKVVKKFDVDDSGHIKPNEFKRLHEFFKANSARAS